jgi:GTP-binding protein
MLDISGLAGRDPLEDYDTINRELQAFDAELAAKPQIVAANKMDLAEARERFPVVRDQLAARGVTLWPISAATGEGINELIREVASMWRREHTAEA